MPEARQPKGVGMRRAYDSGPPSSRASACKQGLIWTFGCFTLSRGEGHNLGGYCRLELLMARKTSCRRRLARRSCLPLPAVTTRTARWRNPGKNDGKNLPSDLTYGSKVARHDIGCKMMAAVKKLPWDKGSCSSSVGKATRRTSIRKRLQRNGSWSLGSPLACSMSTWHLSRNGLTAR